MKEKIAQAYDNTQWFTDREAWMLFKLAAFTEAFGWTLLITGVLFQHFSWPWHSSALLLAGRLHGLFFSVYFMSALLLSKSLGWKKHEVFLAAVGSVPPYGTLVFEQWMAHRRKRANGGEWEVGVRALVTNHGKLLAVLPKDRVFWCLPGGAVASSETPAQALRRLMFELTGVRPTVGKLAFTHNYRHGSKQRLEFVFIITDSTAFKQVKLQKTSRGKVELEDIRFIKPASEIFEPSFLKTENLKSLLAEAKDMPKFLQSSAD